MGHLTLASMDLFFINYIIKFLITLFCKNVYLIDKIGYNIMFISAAYDTKFTSNATYTVKNNWCLKGILLFTEEGVF